MKKILAIACAMLIAACQTIPPEALLLSPESLQNRQLQSRYFTTQNEGDILSASNALLQDMGYTLTESETKLGLLSGEKVRDATNAAEVTLMIVGALFGAAPGPISKEQKIKASLITRPLKNENKTLVRVTFQRVVIDTNGNARVRELLNEPEMYEEFFAKLSKSIFLEAEAI